MRSSARSLFGQHRQWTAAYIRICRLASAMHAPARRKHSSARFRYLLVVGMRAPPLVCNALCYAYTHCLNDH